MPTLHARRVRFEGLPGEGIVDNDDQHIAGFIAGLVVGALAGAGVALLMAPQSGRRTRRHIVRVAEDLGDNARDAFVGATSEARRAVRKAERRGARLRDAARRGVRGFER